MIFSAAVNFKIMERWLLPANLTRETYPTKIDVTCWFESKVTLDESNETHNFCTVSNTQI